MRCCALHAGAEAARCARRGAVVQIRFEGQVLFGRYLTAAAGFAVRNQIVLAAGAVEGKDNALDKGQGVGGFLAVVAVMQALQPLLEVADLRVCEAACRGRLRVEDAHDFAVARRVGPPLDVDRDRGHRRGCVGVAEREGHRHGAFERRRRREGHLVAVERRRTGSASVSAKSSTATSMRRPRRRKASISLKRAMA